MNRPPPQQKQTLHCGGGFSGDSFGLDIVSLWIGTSNGSATTQGLKAEKHRATAAAPITIIPSDAGRQSVALAIAGSVKDGVSAVSDALFVVVTETAIANVTPCSGCPVRQKAASKKCD